jgi:ribosome-associated toxin RatA of RatAB toxin-antitoxin module
MNSASTPSPASPKPPARRWRKRWVLIPGALVLAAAVALAVLYVRGTWADTEPRDPASAADGPVSQIYLREGGFKQVRCAALLPYALDDVWDMLTDYTNYDKMLPYLADVTAEKKGDGEWVMQGQAKSAFRGYWPFQITITQRAGPDGGRIWWDEHSAEGEVQLNRGGWELRKRGDKETLLVLTLEVEVKSTPTFLLRSIFRHRFKEVMRAVQLAVQRRTDAGQTPGAGK